MEEFGPNNYKDVIKKSNEIRNNNIKEYLKSGGSVSGMAYFRDKIARFINSRKWEKSPEITEIDNQIRLERFLRNEDNVQEKIKKKVNNMNTPNIKDLPNDPKARGADGYTSDVIQGIIDEEEAKKEANK